MRAKPPAKPRSKSAKKPLRLGGELWLSVDDVAFLGEERIALLEQIGERGSITQAAKALKVSYKAAWDAVDAINNLAPAPVVETAAGGRGGGGARLTEEGRRLIAAYRTVAAEYLRFLDGINAAMGDSAAALDLLRRLSLRTSARNRFIGRIVSVTARTVDAEVEIEIQGGQRIIAGITNESVETLNLRPGRRVWALVKAVAVGIVPAGGAGPDGSDRPDGTADPATRDASAPAAEPEPAGARLPAAAPPTPPGTNALCGTVQRIVRGDGPAEVVVALAAGVTVRGVIAAERLDGLGIAEGAQACALFPASGVIVGVDC